VDTVVDRPENVRREMRRMIERAILGESVKKQPRQAAVGDMKRKTRRGGLVYSDQRSTKLREGRLTNGTWPIDVMITEGRARVSRNQGSCEVVNDVKCVNS
jgi:hypothetical protein